MIDDSQDQRPATIAFLEAIEAGVDERKLYPDGSRFIDADDPHAGQAVVQAAAEGHPVVLCSADGTRQLLYPGHPAVA